MKKSILHSVLIISFSLIFTSQIFSQITFNRIYGGSGGEQAYSIIQTFDGGYIFTGLITSTNGSTKNIWLVKLDAYGDTLWTKTYGFNWWEEAYEVLQMPDSGYVLLGRSTSASNGLYNDFWLLRTNQTGDTLWTKFYGDLGEQETPTNIITTSDGGFALIGFDQDYVQNGSIWLIKTDVNGDTLWTQKYGGLRTENASCILQTPDSGYILAGSIDYYNNNELYLIKTDINGDTLWTKMYGYLYGDGASDIVPTPDGGYLVAGYKYHAYFGISTDFWLLKINANGDSLWSKYYGGVENDYPFSIHPTLDVNYIIGGSFAGGTFTTDGMMLVKIDSIGDTLWTRRYGGDSNDWGSDAIPTSDSGYILCGYTNSFGALSRDAWIIKTDKLGFVAPSNITEPQILISFQLHQNFPNPFNPITKIKYTLPYPGYVDLQIYDDLGREIQSTKKVFESAGDHIFTFDGSNLSSGVYFYQLKFGNEFTETKKMILMR